MTDYLDPTPEQGRALMLRNIQGPVVMLNLTRFREVADYSGFPALAPASPISGRAAYDLYVEHTTPFLAESGGELLFLGEGGGFLIGPADERWDAAMLVRQTSTHSSPSRRTRPISPGWAIVRRRLKIRACCRWSTACQSFENPRRLNSLHRWCEADRLAAR